jgi:methionyl-tRNA formyltransferase
MKIVFMGTPEFAVPSLKMLADKYNVMAVLTQPDRPKGRGKKLAFSPVKEAAVEMGIKVYQPLKLKSDPEVINAIKEIEPDFIIVVAFGQILPKEVLDIPKYGCINLHASLLPKYRGAAPINWCIINGEKVSGNTTMLMDVGLDTGDMLLKSQYEISDTMTYGELHDILMVDGAELLYRTIEDIVAKKVELIKQDNNQSCYASMLSKETGKIQWNKSAISIRDLIRGLNPWPVAYTLYNGENMKIFKASLIEEESKKDPGSIISVDKKGIRVATGEGILLVEEIQFPNGKRLKIEEYIKGNTIEAGIILGL